MTIDTKNLKLAFAPGALEALEESMSPEELQDLLAEIQQSMDDGSLFADSEPVDMDKLKDENPALYQEIMASLESVERGELEPKLLH